ncbi:ArsR/SmtB family transcription factor [Ferrovibrio sp.]|uniref:ArsR/SmtB family transcription factor n=1 Tax=Ferrovibrio sp. TaxID=1917215 RepID=UPI0035B221BC
MDDVFQALSDSTRRAMLRDLARGPRTVTELAEPHPISLAAASRHIKVLEAAGLVRREVKWRTHFCSLEAAPLARAHSELSFFEQFWSGRLEILDRLLREEDAQTTLADQTKPHAKRKKDK